MPVFDTGSVGTFNGTGSLQTIATFSVANQPGRALLVALSSASGQTPITPSYGGVPMTQILQDPNTTTLKWKIFILIAPPTGSNNLTVTTGQTFSYAYYSLNTAGSLSPDNTGDSGLSNATSQSLSVTPNRDREMVVFMGFSGGGTSGALSGAGAANNQFGGGPGGAPQITVGNSGGVSPISAQAAVYTPSALTNCQLIGICIKPLIQTAVLSDSVLNGAARLATPARNQVLVRASSASIMNGAGRLATVVKGLTRTMSASMMNAAGRFATFITKGSSWVLQNANPANWTDTPK